MAYNIKKCRGENRRPPLRVPLREQTAPGVGVSQWNNISTGNMRFREQGPAVPKKIWMGHIEHEGVVRGPHMRGGGGDT